MKIAIDFDNTIVLNRYPYIGSPVPYAIPSILELQKCNLILLNTMRSDKELQQAVAYLENLGVNLYGINIDPEQMKWSKSSKCYADIYIDDRSLGIPLINYYDDVVVDWLNVMKLLK